MDGKREIKYLRIGEKSMVKNKNRLPFKVHIYGAEYLVDYKPMDSQGETYVEDHVIYLNERYPLSHQKATLIHEILHVAISQRYQYNIEAVAQVEDSSLKEHLVIDACANMVYDIIVKDNPKLQEFLYNE